MIEAKIYDKKLTVTGYALSDGVEFDTVKFNFPDSWNDYQKTAVFSDNDGNTLNIILNSDNPLCIGENECYIPFEMLKFPEFYISVFGIKGSSVATTSKETVRVVESGYALGDKPSEPTPTEYQQLINLASQTKEIAESVRTDADNGLFKGEKGEQGPQGIQGIQGEKGDTGEVSLEYANNTFAPAIRCKATGTTVTVNDVSSAPHKLDVKLSSKNLIPFPYTESSKEVICTHPGTGEEEGRITFTVGEDGSITINGNTGTVVGARFVVADNIVLDKNAGPYYYSCEWENVNRTPTILYRMANGDCAAFSAGPLDASLLAKADHIELEINISANTTINNAVIRPQIERGTTATAYTKNISDFSGVKVSRYGKNLLPDTLERYVGYYQDSAGASIVSNSKNVALARFECLPNTTYTISSNLVIYTVWEYADDSWTSGIKRNADGNLADGQVTFTTTANTHYLGICFKNPTPDLGTNALEWCQMELGTVATEYEPYIEPQFATANAVGTVEGLASISPQMTAFTDNVDTLISLKYNADTKIYIDNMITSH